MKLFGVLGGTLLKNCNKIFSQTSPPDSASQIHITISSIMFYLHIAAHTIDYDKLSFFLNIRKIYMHYFIFDMYYFNI